MVNVTYKHFLMICVCVRQRERKKERGDEIIRGWGKLHNEDLHNCTLRQI
jgi:hypothetical protein